MVWPPFPEAGRLAADHFAAVVGPAAAAEENHRECHPQERQVARRKVGARPSAGSGKGPARA